jgi:hypothetical protein
MSSIIAAMAPDDTERFKLRVRASLPPDSQERVTFGSHANAIKGRVPMA